MNKEKMLQIGASIDYFLSYILENSDVDNLTAQKYVAILDKEYHNLYWKENELDKHLLWNLLEIYPKIEPISNNFPKLKDKYEDISSTINETLNTSGDKEDCIIDEKEEIIAWKKYIVAVLNQNSTYNKTTNTNTIENRNLIDDINKILQTPSVISIMTNSILNLQMYVYGLPKKKDCGGCGNCGSCGGISKWKESDPTYQTVQRQISELNERIEYLEWLKRGPQGTPGAPGTPGKDAEMLEPVWPLSKEN